MKLKGRPSFQKFKWKGAVFFMFLFVFLPFSHFLFAKEIKGPIWIRSYQTPVKEFEAHIKVLGGSHIHYGGYLLSQKRKEAQSFHLQDQLITAQRHYLSGEEAQAMRVFQKISGQALSADWDEEDRRIILYSFLRRAQSEEDSGKRKALLLSVSAFSVFKITPSSYPDYSLFPPPLMEELEQIQQNTNTLSVDWERLFPHHEIILINGRQIQKERKEAFPQAFYRVSALSSAYQPWTKKINLSDLAAQSVKTKSLTKGPCGEEQIKIETGEIDFRVLSPSNCAEPVALFKKDQWEEPAHINKVSFQNEPHNTLSMVSLEDFPLEEKDDQKNTLSGLTPWVILGTGVVVFSLALSLSSKKKSKSVKKEDYVY